MMCAYTIVQVGISMAVRWLASFFAIFEIIKTADILQDAVVLGLDSLLEGIPSEKDVAQAFNSVREGIENLT